MKKTALFTALFALLFSTTLLTADTFEGKVTFAITDKEGTHAVDQSIKQNRIRMEPKNPEAEGAAMILNAEKNEMIMLMPTQKMYMLMPLKKTLQNAANEKQIAEAKIEKTGKTDTILGYPCEQYLTTDGKDTTEIWATEKLGTFMGLGDSNPMEGMMGGGSAKKSSWSDLLSGRKNFFPLRTITRNKAGKETDRMEATKISPEKLPDSLFTIPEGYQQLQMPSLGGFGM